MRLNSRLILFSPQSSYRHVQIVWPTVLNLAPWLDIEASDVV